MKHGAKRRYKTKKLLSESNQTGVLPSFFPKKRFLLCIMGNPVPCGRRSRSHIHSMLLCLLLAKPGIAAYCCAKNKSIKASEAAATFRFSLHTFFSREKKVWSQLSDDAYGEPERSEGNRQQSENCIIGVSQ